MPITYPPRAACSAFFAVFQFILFLSLGNALRAQSWSRIATTTASDLWGVGYGGSQFVAVGTGGTILTSPDGTVWSAGVSGTTEWLLAVACSDRLYVVVGDHGTILTSPDARTWTPRSSGTSAQLNGIAFGGGRFVAVGEAGTVCTSSDAIAWSTTTLPIDTWLRGITYGPDSFLIGAGDGTLCSTSDGVHFRLDGPLASPVEALLYANGTTVAVGNGSISSSADRLSWTQWAASRTARYRSVLHDGNSVIAVGELGAVFTYEFDLASFSTPPDIFQLGSHNLNAIAVGSSGTVIVGDAGTIYSNQVAPTAPSVVSTSVRPDQGQFSPYLGGSVALAAKTAGTPPFVYQWTHEGSPLAAPSTDTLVLKDLTARDAGTYNLTITNASGSATAAFIVAAPVLPPSGTVDPKFTAEWRAASPTQIIPLADGRFLTVTDRIERLNLDGTWDLSFHAAASGSVTLQPDGKLLVYDTTAVARRVVRLDADGARDSGFATDADYGNPVALASGKIACIQSDPTGASMSITRLNPDGSRDLDLAAFWLTFSPTAVYHSSTMDDQGRIYVAATPPPATADAANPYIWLFRLSADGSLDSSFVATQVRESVTNLRWIHGKLCYESVQKLLSSDSTISRSYARLNEDGRPDPTFPRLYFGPQISMFGIPVGTFDRNGGLIVMNYWPLPGLIRYDASGQRDYAFSARIVSPPPIDSLTELADGSIIAAGNVIATGEFASFNGVLTAGLARLVPITDAYATRLANLSLRTNAGTGDQTLIVGFVIAGGSAQSRSVLVRAVGPGLIPLGINAADVLSDPRLTLHLGSATISSNDDWDFSLDARATALGAFPLARNSKDAALLTTLSHGVYTAHVTASNSTTATGMALVELYDADAAPNSAASPRLVNLSGRARVGTGDNVLIAGFVISGHSTERVLIRAVGPGLVSQGVSDALLDPELSVHHGAEIVGENDNWQHWQSDVFSAVGAFPLAAGSADAALVLDLSPGIYSAVVKGVNGSTGTALVEIYEVP